MLIKRRTISYLFIAYCYLLLVSCGGGGGGSTSSSAGKLVPDVRVSGFSAEYDLEGIHSLVVNRVLIETNAAIKSIESELKWPSDLPVVFSGCGTLNAFFSPGLDLHAQFVTFNAAVNAPAVFGPNVTIPAIVLCHEITEKNVSSFLNDPGISNNITTLFAPTTTEELAGAAVISSLVFEFQILFHELGHAVDTLLLKDADNSIKLANYTIPLPNTCAFSNCDTAANDFADWISAEILIQVIKDKILTDSDAANNFAKAWIIALDAWKVILGTGGGVAHGLTDARQANMLCYAYGAIPELRQADAAVLGSGLHTAMTTAGITDPNDCEATYNRNSASTDTLLSSFIN